MSWTTATDRDLHVVSAGENANIGYQIVDRLAEQDTAAADTKLERLDG